MSTRPEEWTIKGVPDDKIRELYGPILKADSAQDREALEAGQRAHARMTATALARYGGNKAVLASAAPWTSQQLITARALLMVRPGGFVPIAHLGVSGYTALTEEQAAAALSGTIARDAEPPGGWRDARFGGLMALFERISDAAKSPAVEAGTVVVSGALLVDRAHELVKKHGLVERVKGWLRRV